MNLDDDRRRKMLLLNNSGMPLAQMLRDGSAFYAPRTSSITQTRGSGTPTITRATTATVTNNDGYLVTALSEELREKGARRIENLITASEDFTQINGGFNLNNTNTANSVTFTDASAYRYKRSNSSRSIGTKLVGSVKLSSTDKATVGLVILEPSGLVTTGVAQITLTPTPTRYYVSHTLQVAGQVVLGLDNRVPAGGDGTATGAIVCTEWQLEDVTAQTTQIAGEYVSVGVLSAPYHGAGVDGVRYFSTDISGNPIPAATLDSSVVEAAATDLCLQSNAFGTTWVKINAGDTLVENNAIGLDGGLTADTLTLAAGTTQKGFQQPISTGAGAVVATFYMGAGTHRYVQVLTNHDPDGYANFDLQTGACAASAGSCEMTMLASGIYSCTYMLTSIGASNVYCIAVDSLAATRYSTTASTGTLIYAACQVEPGSYATAYIPTTTAAATRNKDVLDDQVSGNLTAAAGSVAFQWTPSHAPSGTIALCGSYVDASNYTMVLAQKVTNLILGSSDGITTSPWSLNGVPTAVTSSSITFAATSTNGVRNPSITAAATAAQVFIIRCKAWTDSGTKQFRLQITKPSVANYTSGDFTATTTPTVFYYVATTAAGAASTDAYIINSSDASTGKVNFSEIVVEDVTNNISQFPAPYVSTSTGSATFAIFRKVIAATAYDSYLAHTYVSGTTYDISLRWGASGSQIAVDGVLGTAHANTDPAQLGTRWQWGSDGNGGLQAGAAFKEMYLLPRAMSDNELRVFTA